MRRSEIFPSTHYNAQDVLEGPLPLTIDFAAMEPVGEGANKKEKLVIHFKEEDSKLLVVTPTKFDAIALIAKSDDTDDWFGVKIILEAGKTQFQGKLVDCVHIRPPRNPRRMGAPGSSPLKSPKPPVEEAELDDGVEI
jgi:hypothetical protein